MFLAVSRLSSLFPSLLLLLLLLLLSAVRAASIA
jgi:hypothetical protein